MFMPLRMALPVWAGYSPGATGYVRILNPGALWVWLLTGANLDLDDAPQRCSLNVIGIRILRKTQPVPL